MNKETKKKLLQIADKAFCVYTYERSEHMLENLKKDLSENVYFNVRKLLSQVGNPDNAPQPYGWGNSKDDAYQNACVSLKKYIESLDNNENPIEGWFSCGCGYKLKTKDMKTTLDSGWPKHCGYNMIWYKW